MPSKKIKVLIANDAHYLGTGYGVYGKELLTRLHNSGKYEVAEIGCYADGSHPAIKSCPWKFYPNIPDNKNKEVFDKYSSSAVNQFGLFSFNNALLDFKPDIVFDVRDYWMYAFQETHPYRPFFKWVVMPTVDSAPQREDWLHTFANMDMVVPYTQWAKNTLEKQCGSRITLFPKIANAGINPEQFYPIENKEEHKSKVLNKNNLKITGLVMRNQKRKLIPDMLIAYKKFLNRLLSESKIEEYENNYLYLHTSYPEVSGWDIPSLLIEHELADKVYLTYICKKCGATYPSKFNGSVGVCAQCGNTSAMLPNASNPVDTDTLNKIYNLFDLFVQYAICEGFGMPQIEAASCGVPIASVDYSAMSEIVENLEGYPIPVKRLFRELETGADRAQPDIDATVDILYNFHIEKTTDQKLAMSRKTRELAIEKYTWDGVYNVWDECFSSLDLTSKLPWDAPRRETNHKNLTVPSNLAPTKFVEHICNTIICEPYMLKTAPIVGMIRDFSTGVFCHGGKSVRSYDYQEVAKILEKHLNNKILLEDLRKEINDKRD